MILYFFSILHQEINYHSWKIQNKDGTVKTANFAIIFKLLYPASKGDTAPSEPQFFTYFKK